MTRINILTTDEHSGETSLAGWFDPDTATRFDQDTEWNGHNLVGVITKSEFVNEHLYRTKGGRWILNHDSRNYHDGPDAYEFVTDEDARDWLIRSECNDAAIEQYFGPVEDERGPGRPEVGKPIHIRLGDDLLAQVDAEAAWRGRSRADTIRELVFQALTANKYAFELRAKNAFVGFETREALVEYLDEDHDAAYARRVLAWADGAEPELEMQPDGPSQLWRRRS